MMIRARTALAGGILSLAGLTANAAVDQTYRFEVLLDDKPIGEHRFDIDIAGEQKRVSSEAAFQVDFLIFTAYRYKHQSNEVFRDGCLQRLSSTTDDNGTRYEIDGSMLGDRFRVDRGEEVEQVEGCVKTFAYWDPSILEQPQLLNPQTGELEPVQVRRTGTEQVEAQGGQVSATRYELVTDELSIDLWYNDALGWVRLASDTGKGATLIYRRL
jgi:hypothetical protein